MPGQDGRINVAILAVPEVTASALFGMFDLFSSPGRDWSFIVAGKAGNQRMRPYIVAQDTSGFQAANGIWIRPDHDFSDCPQPDIVCIPDFFVNPGASVAGMGNACCCCRICGSIMPNPNPSGEPAPPALPAACIALPVAYIV